jgi:hypothetical protein
VERVFIEDYVVAFLKQKKVEAVGEPIRIALFGYAEKSDDDMQFFIYGATCEEDDRTAEEVGREFFDGYNFLGFVNVFNNNEGRLSAYHIFFENNEAMQDYLLFCRANNRLGGMGAITNELEEGTVRSKIWRKFKMIVLGGLCIFSAIAITAIDDYEKMNDFTKAAKQAIFYVEENG